MKNLLGAATVTAIIAFSLTSCASLGGSSSPPPTPQDVAPKLATTPSASPMPSPSTSPTTTPTPVPPWIIMADQNIQPTLICIGHRPRDGRYYLRFGYNSTEASAVRIAIDSLDGTTELNRVVVTPANGNTPFEFTGQPTLFSTGSGNVAFDVPVDQKDNVTWHLDGNSLTATTNSAQQCP